MKWCVALIGLVVTACANPGIVDTGRVAVVDAAQLPPPTLVDLSDNKRENLIGPFDQISVDVFGLPELSKADLRVDANGQVSLPVAGQLTAGGKTPAQFTREVEERLRAGGVRNPQVAVNMKEIVSQVVTVEGQVRRPGIYPVSGRATLLRAVARAEGTTDFAHTNHVVVLRTVNSQKMAALYDVRAIRMGAYEDPDIYPNDVIVVGESASKRLLPMILSAAGVVLTPLVYILR